MPSPIIHELAVRRVADGTGRTTLTLGSQPWLRLGLWIGLYSLGQILLTILLATMLFADRKRVRKRNPTLINMIFVSLLSTITPCMLYYAGLADNPNPPIEYCLLQAALKHGTGPMFVVALAALVAEAALITRGAFHSASIQPSRYRLKILLAAPYVTFIIFSISMGLVGAHDLSRVERLDDLFYCSVKNDAFGVVETIFAVVTVSIMVAFEVSVIVTLFCSWRTARKLRTSRRIDVPLLLRIGVFSTLELGYMLIAVLGLLQLVRPEVGAFYEALLPTWLFLIFGMQKDYLDVWLCRRARAAHELPPASPGVQQPIPAVWSENTEANVENIVCRDLEVLAHSSHGSLHPPTLSIVIPESSLGIGVEESYSH